ncbi:hypothetical protein PInf_012050 [Phytophthora infestans]|nr:hypothetical protein PInf_012050 [Phytophthora infestans]
MGLSEDSSGESTARKDDAMQQVSALETQIHECKLQAVQLKRQNQIADALACMRKIKELEIKRDKLRTSAAMSKPSPAAQQSAPPAATEAVYRSVTISSTTSVRLNSSAASLDESEADSDNDSTADVEVTAEDEDYLIDAFDESDSEGKSNHLTTVMSSGSLHSISSVPEMEKLAVPVRYASARGNVETDHIAELTAKLQKARETALTLKRKGDIQGALDAMRRAKQIQNLIDLKQHAADNANTMNSAQNLATAAKFQELEQLLIDFGNRAMTLAKENLSVNRREASEWLAKRKRYAVELEKLRKSRQNSLQLPPRYEIVKTFRQVEYELPFIADDQPGTLFRNPELVARAYQELTPLLTCCEVNTHLPFLGLNRNPVEGISR